MITLRNHPPMGQSLSLSAASACLCVALTITANADQPSDYLSTGGRHNVFTADTAPGVIGYGRSLGPGPTAGYFQPVAFSGPEGVQFTLGQGGSFGTAETRLMAGLQIGQVYRFRITGLPDAEGFELYPSIELIDRTYPPPGLATSFPIQINLDYEDLRAALNHRMVTKVVYLEDPQTALPVVQSPTTARTIDVAEHQDPLDVADTFGRPVAIIRIGSLAPPSIPDLLPQFFFGDPAWAPIFQPQTP